MSLYQEIFKVTQMEFIFYNTKHCTKQVQRSCDCWKLFFPMSTLRETMKISSRNSKCFSLCSLSRDLTVQYATHHTLYFFLLSHLQRVIVTGLGNKNQVTFYQLAISHGFPCGKVCVNRSPNSYAVFRFCSLYWHFWN